MTKKDLLGQLLENKDKENSGYLSVLFLPSKPQRKERKIGLVLREVVYTHVVYTHTYILTGRLNGFSNENVLS